MSWSYSIFDISKKKTMNIFLIELKFMFKILLGHLSHSGDKLSLVYVRDASGVVRNYFFYFIKTKCMIMQCSLALYLNYEIGDSGTKSVQFGHIVNIFLIFENFFLLPLVRDYLNA